MPLPQNHAILIGVESYSETDHLPDVAYAEADVSAMHAALTRLGYREENVTCLVGGDATKFLIEDRVRTLVEKTLKPNDTLLFYFVGHGLAVKRSNFLLAWDTLHQDIRNTSVDLSALVRDLRRSSCLRIQMYLDCCRAEFLGEPGERSLTSRLSEATLEKSLRGAQQLACFSSSRFNQTSHRSDDLQQGIWAHHLAETLSGAFPEILVEQRYLTAGNLQAHLNRKVPATVRSTVGAGANQAPWYFGSQAPEFLVADLAPIIERTLAPTDKDSNAAKEFVLRSEQRVSVRSMNGFKPGFHRFPKVLDRRAEEWVAEIAVDEIKADLARTHESIRANMNYTRKQIEVLPPQAGFGSIRTPDFHYTISVTLDAEDLTRAILTREVADVRHPDLLIDDGFSGIFDDAFDSIRLSFESPIKVEDLIDKAEAQQVPVDYPHDCSSCDFKVQGRGTIHVTESHLTLTYPAGKPLEELASGLSQALRMLPNNNSDPGRSLPAPSPAELE